jgi:hypothetical protein
MRIVTISFLVFALSTGAANAAAPTGEQDGVSSDELRSLATSLPELSGRIQAFQIIYDSTVQRNGVVLATFSEKSGWQLVMFSPIKDGSFKQTWQSGKLADSFSVSSQSKLKVVSLGNEEGVQFEGCAQHVCPDVYSILLYVPSKQTAFTADYVWGKVTYSANSDAAENSGYKAVLANLLKKHKN